MTLGQPRSKPRRSATERCAAAVKERVLETGSWAKPSKPPFNRRPSSRSCRSDPYRGGVLQIEAEIAASAERLRRDSSLAIGTIPLSPAAELRWEAGPFSEKAPSQPRPPPDSSRAPSGRGELGLVPRPGCIARAGRLANRALASLRPTTPGRAACLLSQATASTMIAPQTQMAEIQMSWRERREFSPLTESISRSPRRCPLGRRRPRSAGPLSARAERIAGEDSKRAYMSLETSQDGLGDACAPTVEAYRPGSATMNSFDLQGFLCDLCGCSWHRVHKVPLPTAAFSKGVRDEAFWPA